MPRHPIEGPTEALGRVEIRGWVVAAELGGVREQAKGEPTPKPGSGGPREWVWLCEEWIDWEKHVPLDISQSVHTAVDDLRSLQHRNPVARYTEAPQPWVGWDDLPELCKPLRQAVNSAKRVLRNFVEAGHSSSHPAMTDSLDGLGQDLDRLDAFCTWPLHFDAACMSPSPCTRFVGLLRSVAERRRRLQEIQSSLSQTKRRAAGDGDTGTTKLPLTDGQKRLWNALDGRAVTVKELAKELNTSDGVIRRWKGDLVRAGYRIDRRASRGYFRPDAPPADCN